jgi:chemotaxis family two-component system response regulator Rcp1
MSMKSFYDAFARPIEILLVEDNLGDVRLTREALKEAKVNNNLSAVHNGEEALAFLRRQGPYANAPRPDMILLDLNMPKKDGREALAEIKADPVLRKIPVCVLTTSAAEEDIFRSYDLGANSFITKPVTFGGLVEVLQAWSRYWFEIVDLPSEDGNVVTA